MAWPHARLPSRSSRADAEPSRIPDAGRPCLQYGASRPDHRGRRHLWDPGSPSSRPRRQRAASATWVHSWARVTRAWAIRPTWASDHRLGSMCLPRRRRAASGTWVHFSARARTTSAARVGRGPGRGPAPNRRPGSAQEPAASPLRTVWAMQGGSKASGRRLAPDGRNRTRGVGSCSEASHPSHAGHCPTRVHRLRPSQSHGALRSPGSDSTIRRQRSAGSRSSARNSSRRRTNPSGTSRRPWRRQTRRHRRHPRRRGTTSSPRRPILRPSRTNPRRRSCHHPHLRLLPCLRRSQAPLEPRRQRTPRRQGIPRRHALRALDSRV